MRRITEPLSEMGAGARELENPDRLPIEICGGGLRGIQHRSPRSSAQIKSAVLLAGLSGAVPVSLWEPVRSRDHTERMLQALGVELRAGPLNGGWQVETKPATHSLPPLDMDIPGDPSSAAFLVALALLATHGELRIRGVNINPTRTGYYQAVERMGGAVRIEENQLSGGEPLADLVVRPRSLTGIIVEGGEVPAMIDEIPILACLAARARGETRITGAEELRAKESDRIHVIVENLRSIGVEVEELSDGLVVEGGDHPLSGRIRTHHDHRIAMAFGVLAALPGNEIEIDTPDVVEVSYPGFWETIENLGGSASAR